MTDRTLTLLIGFLCLFLFWLLLLGPHNIKYLIEWRKRRRKGEQVRLRFRWPGLIELRIPGATLRQHERDKEERENHLMILKTKSVFNKDGRND